jgi:hypothetical protein
MVRFHIGVNFLGGGAVDVDEEEGIGFAVLVEFAVAVADEELGTSFAVAVLLFEAFHEFAGGLSLIGLFDSEFG